MHPGYIQFKHKSGLFLPHLCRGRTWCTGNCTRGSREGREHYSGQRGGAGRRVGSSAKRSARRGPAGSHAGRRVGSWRGRRPPAPPRPADISRAPPLASQHPQLPAGPSLLPPRVLPAPSRGAARTGSRRDGKDGAVTAGPEPSASAPRPRPTPRLSARR